MSLYRRLGRTQETRVAATGGGLRRLLPRAALAALAVAVLYALRPGVVENGARSPRVWLATLVVLAAGRGLGLLLERATGRPRLASAASSVAVVAVAAALLVPSFQQRSLDEPFPLAAAATTQLAQPALVAPQPSATALVRAAPSRPPAAPTPAAPAASRPPRAQPAAAPVGAAPAAQQQQPPASTVAPDPVPKRLSAGPLDGIGHDASGGTALYEVDGRTVLRFEDVDIEGTPGPYVYLVRRGARTPDGGLLVGALKAERGSFSYTLPQSFDAGASWTVLVWCRPYDTPVAASDL